MATQHFKRNLLLNLYRGGEKKNKQQFVSSCLLKEIKVALRAYFLRLETPGLPACYPLTIFPFFLIYIEEYKGLTGNFLLNPLNRGESLKLSFFTQSHAIC